MRREAARQTRAIEAAQTPAAGEHTDVPMPDVAAGSASCSAHGSAPVSQTAPLLFDDPQSEPPQLAANCNSQTHQLADACWAVADSRSAPGTAGLPRLRDRLSDAEARAVIAAADLRQEERHARAARTPLRPMAGPVKHEHIMRYEEDLGGISNPLTEPCITLCVTNQLRKYGAIGSMLGPETHSRSEFLANLASGRLRRWSF